MNIFFVFTLASRILLLKTPEPFLLHTPHQPGSIASGSILDNQVQKYFSYMFTQLAFNKMFQLLLEMNCQHFFQNTFLLCSANGSRHAQEMIINEADAMSLTATQDLLPHAPGARRMVVTPHSFRTNAHYKDTTPSILKRLCRRRFKGWWQHSKDTKWRWETLRERTREGT